MAITTPLDPLTYLSAQFGRLPGIGQRLAMRLALYVVQQTTRHGAAHNLNQDLVVALQRAERELTLCQICQYLASHDHCPLCSDRARNHRQIVVVEQVTDVFGFEKSGVFRGLYHVLHGSLSPLNGMYPADLKITTLVQRVNKQSCDEVIFATSANIEGDTTALFIADLLRPAGVLLSRLAKGLPLGAELEYVDYATLGQALTDRRAF